MATRPCVPPAPFTCPRCQRTSYNPNDAREGYCGACHDWTSRPRGASRTTLTLAEVAAMLKQGKAALATMTPEEVGTLLDQMAAVLSPPERQAFWQTLRTLLTKRLQSDY
jgi:hypothetical protein